MPIDFDHLINQVCRDIFGEASQRGAKWTYTPQSGAPFAIDVVFFEAWTQTDQGQGKKTFGAVSTTAPMAFVLESDWPTGVEMNRGDTMTCNAAASASTPAGTVFRVENQNPDGCGMIRIALTRTTFP